MFIGYVMSNLPIETILELNKVGYSITKDADIGAICLYKGEE